MTDFGFEASINNGFPQLDCDYWKSQKIDGAENIQVFDANIKAAFVDLSDISVFKG